MTVPNFSDIPVRFSVLRAYGRSPLHGHHARLDEQKVTSAMQRGTAVHALLFNTRKVIGAPMKRDERTKAYQDFVAANPDTEILTMPEYDKARYMADAVRTSEVAAPVMGGFYETKLLFRWNGLDCRATPDVRGLDYLTELKTSASADPQKFLWHALRMHYHAQLWFQHIACEANNLTAPQHHYIVCVESSPPWAVTVFEVQPRALEQAAKLIALWAERLKTSEASGQWPPYSQSVVPLDIPDDDIELVYPDEEQAE